MDLTQTSELLATIAAFDRRTVGDSDVIAWQLVLQDVDHADALAVVLEHYRDSREWMMPADVRRGVSERRIKRLQGAPNSDELVADVDFDDPAWHIVRRERRRAIAGGMPIEDAIKAITPGTVQLGPRAVHQ